MERTGKDYRVGGGREVCEATNREWGGTTAFAGKLQRVPTSCSWTLAFPECAWSSAHRRDS